MARRRRNRKKENISILAILVCIFLAYNAFEWYDENMESFWNFIFSIAFISALVFVLFKLFKRWRKRKVIAGMPEKVGDIKTLLDKFATDIPKFSKHSEVHYQVDFGRYLKEHLPGSDIVYEEARDGVRPDIVIDKKIAIEIKALKNPNTDGNRKYNSAHIDSIFKKIHTYKVYSAVIIIIFNADYVKNKNWRDYEKMKEAVQEENVVLFEK